MTRSLLIVLISLTLVAGCSSIAPGPPIPTPHSSLQLQAATKAGIGTDELAALLATPLYRMKPSQVGRYLTYLQHAEPDLRARIADLGRKNIGQPYEIYLLGEFPFEAIDDQPLFSLEKSDCVVFAEHTYAMALAGSWEDFFWVLQRIRYRDGVIGVATRNHYTETDWNPQNAWLVKDITAELGGARTMHYPLTVDREKFLKGRYNINRPIAVEHSVQSFVPKEMVAEIASQLRQGDFVNVISSRNGGHWASHVGLVVLGPNGERHFLHSAEPSVREETFESFIGRATERESRNIAAGKPGQVLAGFKFLRLNEQPQVPAMAPQPRPSFAR